MCNIHAIWFRASGHPDYVEVDWTWLWQDRRGSLPLVTDPAPPISNEYIPSYMMGGAIIRGRGGLEVT